MRAKFTGHDTFPLRYGWLYKSTNFIKNKGLLSTSDLGRAAAAIADLGVGKNMVSAMRYWSEATQMTSSFVKDREVMQEVTPWGIAIFDESDGVDPYLDDIGTVWLLHWLLNSDDLEITAYRYFFGYSSAMYFEKTKFVDDLVEEASRLTGSADFKKATVKKDVDCFLATYISKAQKISERGLTKLDEDSFSSPLSELGLIKDMGGGYYQCDFRYQESLPLEIFLFALCFWAQKQFRLSGVTQFTFEDAQSRPWSPGKVFRLSEAAMGAMLDESVTRYGEQLRWIDSQGLKQIVIDPQWLDKPWSILHLYYPESQQWLN